MARSDAENSINTPAPRPPTSQERGDNILMRYRLARAAAHRILASDEVRPFDVLVDILGSGDFDHEIINPEASARLILERLEDAGFEIKRIPD